jgi:serine/threonine-protein kinase
MGEMERDAGVQPGDVLAGKYRVDRVLGVGGMGVVVAAHHIQLDEKVAIKFLLPQMLDVAECVVRFEREARAAVKIKSEHVARVTDVGKLESGAPYMVMEYLEGEDLSAAVQRGPMPIEQAVDFVLQACEAIAEAHSLGIVHRDLKPANMFCIRRRDGQLSIKVLDFGISKITGAPQDVSMTRTTTVIGSPVYMSPEQMKSSKSVDARTDIWALGVILFELITGRVPFQGETITEVAIYIASEPMPAIRPLRPDIPAGLEATIARCLEKDASKRFGNVGELAAELVAFGSPRAKQSFDGIQGTLRSSGIDLAPMPSMRTPMTSNPGPQSSGTVGNWQTAAGGKKTNRTLAGGLVAAGVLAAASLGFVVLHKSEAPPPQTQAAAAAPPPPAPSTVAPAPPPTGAPADEPVLQLVNTPPPAPAPAKPTPRTSAPRVTPPPPAAPAAASPRPAPAPAAPPAAPARPAAAATPSAAPSAKYNPLDHL